jgi:predicted DNA binding CopG/RHH family protein
MSKVKRHTPTIDPIPEFASREEEREFWDTHDLSDYWDQWKPSKLNFKLEPMEQITVTIDAHTMTRIRAEAKERGIDPAILIHIYVLEHFQHQDRAASGSSTPETAIAPS